MNTPEQEEPGLPLHEVHCGECGYPERIRIVNTRDEVIPLPEGHPASEDEALEKGWSETEMGIICPSCTVAQAKCAEAAAADALEVGASFRGDDDSGAVIAAAVVPQLLRKPRIHLWVDDSVPKPVEYNVHTSDPSIAKDILGAPGLVVDLSLDYDLGAGVETGLDIVKWMVQTGNWPRGQVRVHSRGRNGGVQEMKKLIKEHAPCHFLSKKTKSSATRSASETSAKPSFDESA